MAQKGINKSNKEKKKPKKGTKKPSLPGFSPTLGINPESRGLNRGY